MEDADKPFLLGRRNDVEQAHNVGVIERAEQLDFPQRRQRNALAFLLHAHFLQRDHLARLFVQRTVYATWSTGDTP